MVLYVTELFLCYSGPEAVSQSSQVQRQRTTSRSTPTSCNNKGKFNLDHFNNYKLKPRRPAARLISPYLYLPSPNSQTKLR
jgi:hypothetical protein